MDICTYLITYLLACGQSTAKVTAVDSIGVGCVKCSYKVAEAGCGITQHAASSERIVSFRLASLHKSCEITLCLIIIPDEVRSLTETLSCNTIIFAPNSRT